MQFQNQALHSKISNTEQKVTPIVSVDDQYKNMKFQLPQASTTSWKRRNYPISSDHPTPNVIVQQNLSCQDSIFVSGGMPGLSLDF